MMILEFKQNYEDYTDKELVELVTNPQTGKQPNDEGVAFLLYKKYSPLLHKIYHDIYEKKYDFYGDCLGDLYAYLKKGDPVWRKLKNIEWRSSFSTWISKTASRRFIEIKPYLIGKIPYTLSIEGCILTSSDQGNREISIQLPDNGVEEYEDKERKVILMEAISFLKEQDQKFVIIKRLQGYNSKEIAILLQKRWAKHGIIKYNNKKQLIVPDAAYVDVRTQRAKENLKKIIDSLI